MREFIRRACRELGLPVSSITEDLVDQIHNELGPLKPRGGTVSYPDVLSEVHARESSFREGRFVRGRRGNIRRLAGRAFGLATIGVVVIDAVAKGEPPGMQDLAETAITFVPVVGPVASTYLIARPIVEHYTQQALDAYGKVEEARRQGEIMGWRLAYAMAERAMLEYNTANRYPWQGNISSGPEGERWRSVATINYDRLGYCMKVMIEMMHSRYLVRSDRHPVIRIMNDVVNDYYDPCVHNTGDYASTDPALRTFQPRDPATLPPPPGTFSTALEDFRPHAGAPGRATGDRYESHL